MDKQWLNNQINMMLAKKYSQPMTPQERVKGGASVLPVIGDAISGYDAYQSAKQGDYMGAALNAVGMLPLVPGLAGTIKSKTGSIANNLLDKINSSESIKKWAKGSKVVDQSGNPLTLYHGTDANFDKFNTSMSEMGSHFGPVDQANQFASLREGGNVRPVHLNIKNPVRMNDSGGFYPLDVAQELKDRGLLSQDDYKRVYSLLDTGKDSNAIKHIQKRLMDQGYDGIVYMNKHEGLDRKTTSDLLKGNYSTLKNMSESDFLKLAPGAKDSYIAFKPSQIKPAIGTKPKP